MAATPPTHDLAGVRREESAADATQIPLSGTMVLGFPGQGVDWNATVGIVEEHPSDARVRQFFSRVGIDTLDGVRPEDTRICQPAIFLASMLRSSPLRADLEVGRADQIGAVVGHSFGELAALVFAGAYSFEEGLELAARRGELGAESHRLHQGQMLAVIGADIGELEYQRRLALAAHPNAGLGLEFAVINHAQQVVLAGSDECIATLRQAVGSSTVRTKLLPIGGAFHTPAMAQAAAGYRAAAASITPSAPRLPVVMSSGGGTLESGQTPVDLPERLARSLVMLVDWPDTLKRAGALGIERGVDAGPGVTLTKISRRAGMQFVPLGSVEK